MIKTLAIAGVAASWLVASVAVAATGEDTPSPTFTRDVLPILQRSCQDCHRPQGRNLGGMVAPMSLVTYRETRPWAKAIAQAVEAKKMPPWHASEAQRGLFVDERYLTDGEIETLVAWAATGAAEGDSRDAPPPIQFAADDGWHIGPPDLVVKLPIEHCMSDRAEDEYEYFEQTLDQEVLPRDRWIKAFEFRPTGSFVHHVIARPIGGIAPGYQPRVFPEGFGMRLRTGSKIRWELHYHKEAGPGTRVCDSDTAVALRFFQPGEVVTHVVRGENLAVTGLRIPAGEASYDRQAEYTFEEDGYITGFNPHMHLRGKAAKFVARYPNGREEVLLEVPQYDFNWQHSYTYHRPVFAPKGTTVRMTLWWDNSARNPANPDPTAVVTWGQPTTAEMGLGFMKFIEAKPVHLVIGEEGAKAAPPGVEAGNRSLLRQSDAASELVQP